MRWLLLLKVIAGGIAICTILCLIFPSRASSIIDFFGDVLSNIIDND